MCIRDSVFGEIRQGAGDVEVLTVLTPVYVALSLVGVASYVACIELVRRYVRRGGASEFCAAVEIGLHAAAAVGVYLGRVGRRNSWHVLTEPLQVAQWLGHLVRPLAAIAVVLAFTTFTAMTVISRHVARRAQRAIDQWRWHIGL